MTCTPQTITFTAYLGFSHPPTSKLECQELRWFWVAKDANLLQYLSPVTEKNQVSLMYNFEIEPSDQNAEAGKGQWREPLQVDY